MKTWILLIGIFSLCLNCNGATIADKDPNPSEAVKRADAFLASLGGPDLPKTNRELITIYIDGEIKPGDEIAVNSYLAMLRKNGKVLAVITSGGGDVLTSMKIGRMLRQYESTVSTGYCMSSCVLILAGGIKRNIMINSEKPGIGIHRLYFGSMNPEISVTEVTRRRELIKIEVANYIKEMNISNRLLDMMEAIPPEKMKILRKSELVDLGLDAVDAVWDEMNVAKEAAHFGLTSSQFRRLRANIDESCPRKLFNPQASDSTQVSDMKNHFNCEQATYWGTTVEEYIKRKMRYASWAAVNLTSPSLKWSSKLAQKCSVQFMRFNDQSCGP